MEMGLCFQQMLLEQLDFSSKQELQPLFTYFTKINLKIDYSPNYKVLKS